MAADSQHFRSYQVRMDIRKAEVSRKKGFLSFLAQRSSIVSRESSIVSREWALADSLPSGSRTDLKSV